MRGSSKCAAEVFAQWRGLADSGVNNRAAAARLGLSEAELTSSACGSAAIRLATDARALLERVQALGAMKLVVRNDFAVIERTTAIERIAMEPGILEVFAPDTVLRLDAACTASAFALTEHDRRGVKRSVLLFDASGASLVKFVIRNDNGNAFDALARDLRHPSQSSGEPMSPSQTQSVRRAGRPASLADFLEAAARAGIPIEWTVANSGASLAVRAAIARVKRSEHAPWINVLDPGLDLHLHDARIVALDTTAAAGLWLSDEGTIALSASSLPPEAAFEARVADSLTR